MRCCFLLVLVALTSCMQRQSEDDDFNLIPTTNNPHIVPNHGGFGGIPMPS